MAISLITNATGPPALNGIPGGLGLGHLAPGDASKTHFWRNFAQKLYNLECSTDLAG